MLPAEVAKVVDAVSTQNKDPIIFAPAFLFLGSSLRLRHANHPPQTTEAYVKSLSSIIDYARFRQSRSDHVQAAQDLPNSFLALNPS